MVNSVAFDRYDEEEFLREDERPNTVRVVVPSWKGGRWAPVRPSVVRSLYPTVEACGDVLKWSSAAVRATFDVADAPAAFVPDLEVTRRAETVVVHFLDADGRRADLLREVVEGMAAGDVRVRLVSPALAEDRVVRRAAGLYTMRGDVRSYASGEALPTWPDRWDEVLERWLGRGGGTVEDFVRGAPDDVSMGPGGAGAFLAAAVSRGRASVDFEADPSSPVTFRAPGTHPRPDLERLMRVYDASAIEPDDGLRLHSTR